MYEYTTRRVENDTLDLTLNEMSAAGWQLDVSHVNHPTGFTLIFRRPKQPGAVKTGEPDFKGVTAQATDEFRRRADEMKKGHKKP